MGQRILFKNLKPWTLHHVMLRDIEKRQIDDLKDRQSRVKYLCDFAEETEPRFYVGCQ